MDDFSGVGAMLKRIRGLQPTTQAPPTWRDPVREQLHRMPVDPDHAKLVLVAPECPVRRGHVGSEAARAAAETWRADATLRLLVLSGPTGRGKTVVATWLAAHEPGTLWVSAKDVRVGEAWSAVHGRCLYVPQLVIDDLGQEASEWATKELAALIESRWDKGKRTIITTNLTPSGQSKNLETTYGARLWSRLGSPRSLIVACGGMDMRRA